jgi:hypothetical protein
MRGQVKNQNQYSIPEQHDYRGEPGFYRMF